jgi:predicted nucleic acid-binding protein
MGRRRKRRGLPLAVIDNSLLTRLVNLGIAEFLPNLFKYILIPPEVKREAYKAPHKGKRRLRKAIGEMGGFFVDCYEVDESIKVILKADLDEGEAAAIAQAEFTESILLLDEWKGFKRATNMGLEVMRTGNLLVKLKEARSVPEIKPYLQKLKASGFHMDEKVWQQLLTDAGEE